MNPSEIERKIESRLQEQTSELTERDYRLQSLSYCDPGYLAVF